MADQRRCQVLVVGAGLSGLSAAKLLLEGGIDVLVLEAEDRVGGRLHTVQNDQVGYADVGGAYIGPTQNRVFRMLKEMGLESYKVYEKGKHVLFEKEKPRMFSDALTSVGSGAAYVDANNMYRLMDKYAKEIPADCPWNAPRAEQWDNMTLQQWMDKVLWTRGIAYGEGKLNSLMNFAAEPTDISLLWALWHTKLAGGTAMINRVQNGAQEQKIKGGAQQIPERIAEGFSGNVILNEPVQKLVSQSDGVTVFSRTMTIQADLVIIATPPGLQRNIEFSPPLSPERNQLIQRSPMGCVIKTMVYYDRPYWRQQGLSGASLNVDCSPSQPVSDTLDDSKPDGSYPCIVGQVELGRP